MFCIQKQSNVRTPDIPRRTFLCVLGAFFAATGANRSAVAHALAGPSDRTPPNTPHSLDDYMLTVNVAQNLYVPLGHTAASLS